MKFYQALDKIVNQKNFYLDLNKMKNQKNSCLDLILKIILDTKKILHNSNK